KWREPSSDTASSPRIGTSFPIDIQSTFMANLLLATLDRLFCQHRLLVALACLLVTYIAPPSQPPKSLPEQNGVELLEPDDLLTRESLLAHVRMRAQSTGGTTGPLLRKEARCQSWAPKGA
ncbi:unnamed protein product, partial [Durusdinium trenchii]